MVRAALGLNPWSVLNDGLSIAVYVGARLGPGPRDGLMTGAAALTGRSIRSVRTLIEITVLLVGWALGGTVGVGTVLYALAVGPVTQFLMPRFVYNSSVPSFSSIPSRLSMKELTENTARPGPAGP
ncbi:hypothetical protein OG389_34785 [Streptomyces sp. NBC_00435]